MSNLTAGKVLQTRDKESLLSFFDLETFVKGDSCVQDMGETNPLLKFYRFKFYYGLC